MKRLLFITLLFALTAQAQIKLDGGAFNSPVNIAPHCGWTIVYEESVGQWQVKPLWTYEEHFMNMGSNLPTPNRLNFVITLLSGGTNTLVQPVDGDMWGRMQMSTGAGISGAAGIGTTNFAASAATDAVLSGALNHSYTVYASGVGIPILSNSVNRFKFYVGMLGGMTVATTLPLSVCFIVYD